MCLFSRIKIFQIGQIFQINDPPNRLTTNLNKDLPPIPASLICQRELIAPKICVVVSFNLRNHLDYASTRNRHDSGILPKGRGFFSTLCLTSFRSYLHTTYSYTPHLRCKRTQYYLNSTLESYDFHVFSYTLCYPKFPRIYLFRAHQ